MNRFHHYLLKIYNIHKKLNLGYFQKLGLSQGQPKLLEILLYNDGCPQKELASACELQPATISSLLKKMEKDELVRRIPETQKNGTHIVRIFLTSNGKELAHNVLKNISSAENLCFKGFSAEEKEKCLSYLNRIYNNLKQ